MAALGLGSGAGRRHDPDWLGERLVNIGVLTDLLTGQLRAVDHLEPDRPGGWQELLCAADVQEALRSHLPAQKPQPIPGLTELSGLLFDPGHRLAGFGARHLAARHP